MTKNENQFALVTGGTDGVGLSIVKALVKAGYSVTFIGSNKTKGEAALAELKSLVKSKAEITFLQLDLSDLKAVKTFAETFSKSISRLDVLLFSAGVMMPKREVTKQGFEKTFAINYLSAYVIAKALGPVLEKTKNARVLTVSGGAPIVLKPRLDFDNLNLEKGYIGFKAAANAVHAKVVLSQILAEKFAGKGVDSNTFHPGIVKGDLGRNMPFPLSVVFKTASLLMPVESKSGIHACLSDSLTGVSGKFLYNKTQIPLKFSEAYKNNLIEKTEAMLKGV